MNQSEKYDLTQGGILNRLLLVALPIMGTQLLQMAYNLTDMFWLGRVGSAVVAASGSAGMYLWLSNGLMFMGRMGAEIGVSQQLGKGDAAAARRYSENSLFLGAALGVLFGVLMMVFSGPLIGFFNIRDAYVSDAAVLYLVITATAIPATFISAAVAGTFNASGNSRVPFLINLAGLVFNMVLDPVLIFGMDMGIAGAAVATAIAQWIVAFLSLLAVKLKPFHPFGQYHLFARPDRAMIVQIFKWSTPVCMESMLFTLLSMIISRFVASWGTDAIAVLRVGSQIESLSWLIGGGFSSAITAFVGQNYGAAKWWRIRSGFGISLAAIVLWGFVVTALLVSAGGFFFRLFLHEPHLIEMGVVYLRILAFCQVFGSLEAAGSGVFRGIGRTLPPSVVSIVCNAVRVLIAYLLSMTALGLNGLWWGICLGAIMRGVWIFIWCLVMFRRQPGDDILAA